MAGPRTPKGRTREVARRLVEMYPEAICELDHTNPFELLTATILSAQTTDARVNMVTPTLFAAYPTAAALAAADPFDVEEIIRSTGFYQNKAKSIIGMAVALVDRFDGEVPTALTDLVTMPGVGRKTGNVVRSVAFGLPGLAVDTHVSRVSKRLGLTTLDDPVKVELELSSFLPGPETGPFSLRLILHGRRVCDAKKPQCGVCALANICPSSLLAANGSEKIGGDEAKVGHCHLALQQAWCTLTSPTRFPPPGLRAMPGSAAWHRSATAPQGAVAIFPDDCVRGSPSD